MPIQILSHDLINQIAAGEVVERPAHLLKELLENALDAGATEIEVELSQGGRTLRVTDNGHGIPANELRLAIERHATSKIRNIDDLWAIESFGFRGEALASAGSVSRLTLKSRVHDPAVETASQISVEFGRAGDVSPAGGAPGTQVLIEDLFENVPARKKFLKSDSAEIAQAKNVLRNVALANPHVLIRAKVNGELVYYWPPVESKMERVKSVFEENELFESFAEAGSIKAHVIAGSPNVTVPQSKKILIFVKNRPVQDRSLQTAVIDAYRTLLMHGEFPVAAVFIECPPSEVDVNIHPSKSQVKFREPSWAFRAVHRATRNMLEQGPWLKSLLGGSSEMGEKRHGTDAKSTAHALDENASHPTANLELQTAFASAEFTQTHFQRKQAVSSSPFERMKSALQTPSEKPNSVTWSEALRVAAQPEPTMTESASPTGIRSSRPNAASWTTQAWSSLHLIGQAHLTYILAQNDQSLILIDQHAAHERVNFERLMQSFRDRQFEVQSFLLPVSIELEEHLCEKLQTHFEDFEARLGLSLDRVGPTTIAIRAAPSLVSEAALSRVVETMAHEVDEKGDSFALENCISHLFATMACHSSIRAGQALSFEEMRGLLKQMDEFPMSSFCPHGRPVYIEYSFVKLERDFGRLV